MLSTAERAALPDLPIPEHARVGVGDKPVFFGHYWLTGTPSLQSDRAACVDYSAGNGGPLVAYRFGAETELSVENFVWVSETATAKMRIDIDSGKVLRSLGGLPAE